MMCWLPVLLLLLANPVYSWDQDEMDMYDLIEEIGQQKTFYQMLGVDQNATSSEIRRAFRQLSLTHHPDKSDAEDANVVFRQLVGVYEVLRSEERRRQYDTFLVEGMPDWRSALFYYRRIRKMGMLEVTAILSIITTVGQYLTAWAGYKEKRLAVEDLVRNKFKRERKKGNDVDFDQLIEQYMRAIEKPSWWNTLPFQLVRGVRWLLLSAPSLLVGSVREEVERRRQQERQAELERQQQQQEREEAERQRDRRRELKERRRQRQQEALVAAAANVEETDSREGGGAITEAGDSGRPGWSTARAGGLWTDDDLAELARLVKKYPGGIPERWERIAELMERTVYEVTKMAAKIRDRPHLVPVSSERQSQTASGQLVSDTVLEYQSAQQPRKVKTRAAAAPAADTWTQAQQKALELALANYPKGTAERWDRIAKMVPDKTKEECMQRFRHLAEQVRRKKEGGEEGEAQCRGDAQTEAESDLVTSPVAAAPAVPAHSQAQPAVQ